MINVKLRGFSTHRTGHARDFILLNMIGLLDIFNYMQKFVAVDTSEQAKKYYKFPQNDTFSLPSMKPMISGPISSLLYSKRQSACMYDECLT
jgi:hypothetical protein